MLSRLLPYVRAHGRYVGEAFVLILVVTAIDMLVLPVMLTVVILIMLRADVLVSGTAPLRVLGWDASRLFSVTDAWRGQPGALVAAAAVTACVVVAKLLADQRRVTLRHRVAQSLSHDLRMTLFASLVAQPVAFHEAQQSGGLLSRVTGDIDDLQERIAWQAFELLATPLAATAGIVLLIAVSWKLVLVTLALAPLTALGIHGMSRRVRVLTERRSEAASDLNGYLAERLANMRTIQGFSRETFEVDAVRRLSLAFARATAAAQTASDRITPFTEFLALISVLVGGVAGGLMVFHGQMSPQRLVLFFTVAPTAINRLSHLTRLLPAWQQIVGRAERVFALLDLVPAVHDKPDALVLPRIVGAVRFEGVTFSYRPGHGRPALATIDIAVEPGETLAIVGPSGAGKSTLVSLLPRFFDPQAGRVLVDGHDLRDVTLVSLRSQIGLVSQESILFNRTIRDNVGYGRLGASDDEIRAALDAANASEFVDTLPHGIDTLVGERGVSLSAGQRQRLALARAVLRDPRLVILDEATSALDSANERLVQEAVGRFVAGRTTFVIAHRLSTIRQASRIVVLDRGILVQMGTHDTLVRQEGLYRRLYDLQRF